MNKKLLERIPRLPHWRYVLWFGEKHPEYDEAMAALARYIEEEGLTVDLSRLDDPDDISAKKALEIFQTPPFRSVMENFLIENCNSKVIVDAFWHKFKESITTSDVRTYRRFFFDMEVVNTYDVAKYYEKTGKRLPKAPPVPGKFREAYTAFKQGEAVSINPDDIAMHMFYHAFFRAQELAELGWHGDDKSLRYLRAANDMLKTMKDTDSVTDLPDQFNFEVQYPEHTAIDAESLEGYDPNEDNVDE